MRNSISDTLDYKTVCKNAATNQQEFNGFKKNIKYKEILEHVTYEQGLIYLNYIKSNNVNLLKNIENFKKNDMYGGSETFKYDIGDITPSTLRYIKVLTDLIILFGDLTNKKIIEIGTGYGGQCLITNQYFKLDNYNLVDLDDVLLLNSKYLDNFNITYKSINIKDIDSLNEDYDIVISNYAYTELTKELQDLYYDKIIKKSKNGYFTVNFISQHFGINSYNYNELLNLFSEKQPKLMEETPKTHEKNLIMYF